MDDDILNNEYIIDEPDELIEEFVIDESDVDKARKKLDGTEPAKSYQRYFLYSKGDQKAKCRVCETVVSRKNYGTTGIDKHLKLYHKKFYAEFVNEAKKKAEKRKATPDVQKDKPEKIPPKQTKILDYKPAEKWNKNRISESINSLMQNFNIGREKVQIIMRDAASAMRLALEFAEFESFDCFVHKFQLVFLPL